MDTHLVLKDFFSRQPEYLLLVTKDYPSHNPDHVEVWEALFQHVFNGDCPVDVEYNHHPLYRREGSTDPRWDVLIHRESLGFGKAMNQFIHDYMRSALCITPTIQEAA